MMKLKQWYIKTVYKCICHTSRILKIKHHTFEKSTDGQPTNVLTEYQTVKEFVAKKQHVLKSYYMFRSLNNLNMYPVLKKGIKQKSNILNKQPEVLKKSNKYPNS